MTEQKVNESNFISFIFVFAILLIIMGYGMYRFIQHDEKINVIRLLEKDWVCAKFERNSDHDMSCVAYERKLNGANVRIIDNE